MHYITKKFSIDMGHILEASYTKACQQFHGHTYYIKLTLSRSELTDGMVVDFTKLKEIFEEHIKNKYDHHSIVSHNTYPSVAHIPGMVEVFFNPTAENIAKHFFDILSPVLRQENINLLSVEVQETDGNVAGYCIE